MRAQTFFELSTTLYHIDNRMTTKNVDWLVVNHAL